MVQKEGTAGFDPADSRSIRDGATSVEQVDVVIEQKAVSTQPELYLSLMHAMRDGAHAMQQYLKTGDLNDARRATNAWMIVGTAKTRRQCGQMWGGVIAGMHPLSKEERKKAQA